MKLKKQMLLFLFSTVALLGSLVGFSFAYFSFADTIDSNIIISGNLRADIELRRNYVTVYYLRYGAELEPEAQYHSGIIIDGTSGIPSSGYDFYLTITNRGSISGNVNVTLTDTFLSTSCADLNVTATCTNLAYRDPSLAIDPVTLTVTSYLNGSAMTGGVVSFTGTQLLESLDPAAKTKKLMNNAVTLAPTSVFELKIHVDIELNNDFHNVLNKLFIFITSLQIDLIQTTN